MCGGIQGSAAEDGKEFCAGKIIARVKRCISPESQAEEEGEPERRGE